MSINLPPPLAAMRYARRRATPVDGVLEVQDAFLPWRRAQGEDEKRRLVEWLAGQYAWCGLWLDGWNAELAGALGSPGALSSGTGTLLSIRPPELPGLLLELHQGYWGLFFGRASCRNAIRALPADATALRQAMRVMNASAAIVSWYDDINWLVGLEAADPG